MRIRRKILKHIRQSAIPLEICQHIELFLNWINQNRKLFTIPFVSMNIKNNDIFWLRVDSSIGPFRILLGHAFPMMLFNFIHVVSQLFEFGGQISICEIHLWEWINILFKQIRIVDYSIVIWCTILAEASEFWALRAKNHFSKVLGCQIEV